MALVAPILIRCTDYLAYGTIFTHAMFSPKQKLGVLFARKAVDERWEVVQAGPTNCGMDGEPAWCNLF
jgi:hypothetical protein